VNVFYDNRHRLIYAGIVELFEKNITADIITLTNQLEKNGTLKEAGGTYYIAQIMQNTPTYANYLTHCRILQEHYFKRCFIEVANNIKADCYDECSDALELIDKIEAEVFRIAEQRVSNNYKDMSIIAKERIELLSKQMDETDNRSVVPTGYKKLDAKLNGGLHGSELIVLAARPSMGKTAFALAIAYNVAKNGIPVGFFTLEMTATQIYDRLLNIHNNLEKSESKKQTIQKILNDKRRSVSQEFICNTIKAISNLEIYFDDTPTIKILELRAKCRQMKAEKDVGLIVVDYLQLIKSAKAESREREVSIISSTLKQISRELEVPVLALSQLNRVYETRLHNGKEIDASKIPLLSDLRESGSIEQDADVVMFLHRPEAILQNEPNKEEKIAKDNYKNLAQIGIGKQRNGATGIVNLHCEIEYGIFLNKT
jgi:replicative DNA helicase